LTFSLDALRGNSAFSNGPERREKPKGMVGDTSNVRWVEFGNWF